MAKLKLIEAIKDEDTKGAQNIIDRMTTSQLNYEVDDTGNTSLHWVVYTCNIALVKPLFNKLSDMAINATNDYNMTAINYATILGDQNLLNEMWVALTYNPESNNSDPHSLGGWIIDIEIES